MMHRAWSSIVEVPYCFPRSSIKFQGPMGQNITHFDPNWAFPDYRPVAAFKSLRFALFLKKGSITRRKLHNNGPRGPICHGVGGPFGKVGGLITQRTPLAWTLDFSIKSEAFSLSICPSVAHSDNFPVIVSSWNFQKLLPLTDKMSKQKVKVRGQRSMSQRPWPHLAVSGP